MFHGCMPAAKGFRSEVTQSLYLLALVSLEDAAELLLNCCHVKNSRGKFHMEQSNVQVSHENSCVKQTRHWST